MTGRLDWKRAADRAKVARGFEVEKPQIIYPDLRSGEWAFVRALHEYAHRQMGPRPVTVRRHRGKRKVDGPSPLRGAARNGMMNSPAAAPLDPALPRFAEPGTVDTGRHCSRCGATIAWVKIDNRVVAIDPRPHPKGPIRLHQRRAGGMLTATILGPPAAQGRVGFRLHDETCRALGKPGAPRKGRA